MNYRNNLETSLILIAGPGRWLCFVRERPPDEPNWTFSLLRRGPYPCVGLRASRRRRACVPTCGGAPSERRCWRDARAPRSRQRTPPSHPAHRLFWVLTTRVAASTEVAARGKSIGSRELFIPVTFLSEPAFSVRRLPQLACVYFRS